MKATYTMLRPMYKCDVCGCIFSDEVACAAHCKEHDEEEWVYTLVLIYDFSEHAWSWTNGPWMKCSKDSVAKTPKASSSEGLSFVQIKAQVNRYVTYEQAVQACLLEAKRWTNTLYHALTEEEPPEERHDKPQEDD